MQVVVVVHGVAHAHGDVARAYVGYGARVDGVSMGALALLGVGEVRQVVRGVEAEGVVHHGRGAKGSRGAPGVHLALEGIVAAVDAAAGEHAVGSPAGRLLSSGEALGEVKHAAIAVISAAAAVDISDVHGVLLAGEFGAQLYGGALLALHPAGDVVAAVDGIDGVGAVHGDVRVAAHDVVGLAAHFVVAVVPAHVGHAAAAEDHAADGGAPARLHDGAFRGVADIEGVFVHLRGAVAVIHRCGQVYSVAVHRGLADDKRHLIVVGLGVAAVVEGEVAAGTGVDAEAHRVDGGLVVEGVGHLTVLLVGAAVRFGPVVEGVACGHAVAAVDLVFAILITQRYTAAVALLDVHVVLRHHLHDDCVVAVVGDVGVQHQRILVGDIQVVDLVGGAGFAFLLAHHILQTLAVDNLANLAVVVGGRHRHHCGRHAVGDVVPRVVHRDDAVVVEGYSRGGEVASIIIQCRVGRVVVIVVVGVVHQLVGALVAVVRQGVPCAEHDIVRVTYGVEHNPVVAAAAVLRHRHSGAEVPVEPFRLNVHMFADGSGVDAYQVVALGVGMVVQAVDVGVAVAFTIPLLVVETCLAAGGGAALPQAERVEALRQVVIEAVCAEAVHLGHAPRHHSALHFSGGGVVYGVELQVYLALRHYDVGVFIDMVPQGSYLGPAARLVPAAHIAVGGILVRRRVVAVDPPQVAVGEGIECLGLRLCLGRRHHSCHRQQEHQQEHHSVDALLVCARCARVIFIFYSAQHGISTIK